MFIWKMAYNFQSNYSHTTKIRQVCSRVICVHIVLISCNFVGYSVSKLGICMRDGNMTPPPPSPPPRSARRDELNVMVTLSHLRGYKFNHQFHWLISHVQLHRHCINIFMPNVSVGTYDLQSVNIRCKVLC